MSTSEIRQAVGIQGKEKTKINSVDLDTFYERIDKINASPIEQVRKLINPNNPIESKIPSSKIIVSSLIFPGSIFCLSFLLLWALPMLSTSRMD